MYTYIEIIKEIEEIFPPTSKFDYTELSPEELWNKVNTFFEKHGFKERIRPDELETLKNNIMMNQQILFGKNHTVIFNIGSNNNHGFDRNNYFLSNKVLYMKDKIYELLAKKNYIDFINPKARKYSGESRIAKYEDRMGTDEEIEKLIEHDSIERYVKDLLYTTKEDNDNFHIDCYLIFRNIMHHFGFTDEDKEIESAFATMLERALINASTFYGEQYSDGTFDGVEQNQKRFHECLQEVERFIVSYIETTAKRALQKRKEDEISKHKAQSEVKKPQPEPMDSIFAEKPKDPKAPTRQFEEKPVATTGNMTVEELEENIILYKKLIEITEQRKQLAEQKKEMEQKISELKKIVEDLAASDQELASHEEDIKRKLGI